MSVAFYCPLSHARRERADVTIPADSSKVKSSAAALEATAALVEQHQGDDGLRILDLAVLDRRDHLVVGHRNWCRQVLVIVLRQGVRAQVGGEKVADVLVAVAGHHPRPAEQLEA